jgi:hypothetical protein
MKKKTVKKKSSVKKANKEEQVVLNKGLEEAVNEIRSLLLKIGFFEVNNSGNVFEWSTLLNPATVISFCIDSSTVDSWIALINIDEKGVFQDCIILQGFKREAVYEQECRHYIVAQLYKIVETFDAIYKRDEEFDETIVDTIEFIKSLPYKN